MGDFGGADGAHGTVASGSVDGGAVCVSGLGRGSVWVVDRHGAYFAIRRVSGPIMPSKHFWDDPGHFWGKSDFGEKWSFFGVAIEGFGSIWGDFGPFWGSGKLPCVTRRVS